MYAPMSSLMKKVLRKNREIERDLRVKLTKLDSNILDIRWPLQKMEEYYLNSLEEMVCGDKIKDEKMQNLFDNYISMRNIFVNEKRPYCPIPINSIKEPRPKLHYSESDKRFDKLKKSALEKGYPVTIHNYNIQ